MIALERPLAEQTWHLLRKIGEGQTILESEARHVASQLELALMWNVLKLSPLTPDEGQALLNNET